MHGYIIHHSGNFIHMHWVYSNGMFKGLASIIIILYYDQSHISGINQWTSYQGQKMKSIT